MSYERDLEKTADHYTPTILAGWESLYSELRKAMFKRVSEYFKPGRVLEMGCGDGEMTHLIAPAFEETVVVDGSKKMLEEAEARVQQKNVQYVWSTFEEFKPTGSFNTIIMSHILEHLDDPVQVLQQAVSWLADDGHLIIAVPNAGSLHRRVAVKMGLLNACDELNKQDLLLGHRRVYWPETLRNHCQQVDSLEVVATGGCMLKPLTNRQIEKEWSQEMIQGFLALGDDFPELCAEIFIVLKRKQVSNG